LARISRTCGFVAVSFEASLVAVKSQATNMADTTRFVPEHRRQAYKGKNLFKGDELRRRREEQQVEIRKQKKDENLAKRRNLTAVDMAMESDTDEDTAVTDEKVRISFCKRLFTRSGEKNYLDWCRQFTPITSMTNYPRQCSFENSSQKRRIRPLRKSLLRTSSHGLSSFFDRPFQHCRFSLLCRL
jgi:hypothetical protein